MQPIDNLRCLLEGGGPEWIPFSLDVGAMPGFTGPVGQTFQNVTGADDPAEYFHTDIRSFSLKTRFGGEDPASLQGPVPPGTTFDEWGIGHLASGTEGTVDKTFSPLARATTVEEIESLPSPLIESRVDASPLERYHARGYPVFGYGGSVYEWSWWLRGMENFMLDLVSNPAMAEALIRKVEAHTTRLALASARIGIDVLCMYDDAGMQRGMQISPDLWRRYVKPVWRRVIEAVRGEAPHVKFFLHNCGKIDAIIPDVIDVGFDVLHPVQPECMDFESVYRQYGRDIVVTATISAQRVFPFGSPEDVRREVRRLAGIVAADRRCILLPSNMIQPETPWQNVVAFAEEARALRDGTTEPR